MQEILKTGQDISGEKTSGRQLQLPWEVGWGEFTQIYIRIAAHDRKARPNKRPTSRIVLPLLVTRFIPGLDTVKPVGEEPVVKPE